MDNLKTWWDFRAQWKVWMTVGGEVAQPVLDWHPVAVSAHSVGGNKAQCHGNHIKSTLKLIYLQKQWKLCWYSPFFALGVCFYNPMSISVRLLLWKKKQTKKNQSGENDHVMVYPHLTRQVSHLKQYIQYVYVYEVFSVCQWLYLFYTVHTCNNVLCSWTKPRAISELSAKIRLKWGVVLTVLPLMLDAHGQSPHVVSAGCAVPFIAALTLWRGCFSAVWHCGFTF